MQSKNAIGNLIRRYSAVLHKCNFLNRFSSPMRKNLKITGLCACIALAPLLNAHAASLSSSDYYVIEETKENTDYYTTFDLLKNDISTNFGFLFKAGPGSTATFTTPVSLANALILQDNPNYTIASGSGGLHDFSMDIAGENVAYTVTAPSLSSARIGALTTNISGDVFYGLTSATRSGAIEVNTDNVNIDGTFIANTAGALGGAITLWGVNNITASGTFIGNSATNNGGAIYVQYGNNSLINGVFIGNTSLAHGGAVANAATLDSIEGLFIGNSAKQFGGAVFNNSNNYIHSIEGIFIANQSLDVKDDSLSTPYLPGGGAIFNGDRGVIDSIDASFIGNTANHAGGALINRGFINALNGIFVGNSAMDGGGALYNFSASNGEQAQIYALDASFINNKTTGATGAGGAIWTNRDLDFQADNRVNIFSGNTDSSGYNAIYVDDSNHDLFVSLNFAMLGTGGFIMNDSIRSNGIDFYDVNISGNNSENNVFMLNNTISEVKTLRLENSTLRMGSTTHDGQDFSGIIYTRNAFFGEGSIFEAPIDNGPVVVSSGGYLYIDDDAKLNLVGTAPTGSSVTIAEGFTRYIPTSGWSDSNLTYTSPTSLQQITTSSFDFDTGTFSVTIDHNSSAGILEDYVHMQSSVADFLSHTNADVDTLHTGSLLLSRAADTRYIGRDNPMLATNTIEGILHLSYLAGLNKTGQDIALASANSVQTRLGSRDFGTTKGEEPVVTMHKTVENTDNAGLPAGSPIEESNIQNGFALWLSPLFMHTTTNGYEIGNFEHSRNTDLGGLSLGGDYTFDEKYRLGLAFNVGSGHTYSQGDFTTTKNDFEFWNVSLYGGLYNGNLALLADVGLSNVYGEVNQELPASMQTNLTADTTSTVWTAGVRAEYTSYNDFVDVTPYLSARYTYVQTDEYSIENDGMIMNDDGQGLCSFLAGVSLAKEITSQSGWIFSPKLDLGVVLTMGDLDTIGSASSADGSATFTYTLQNTDRVAFKGGAGLKVAKDDFSMGLNYNVLASTHEMGHTLNAVFTFEF